MRTSDKPYWYTLDGRKPVPVSVADFRLDPTPFILPQDKRVVAQTEIGIGKILVSTVFLQLDHNHRPDGPPILFETMVFGGAHDQAQERYSTWEQAEAGHARWVAKVKEAQQEP